LSSPWWSISQAIIWIVTRSESHLLRVDAVRTLAGVERMKGIRPASSQDESPVSLTAAPNVLLNGWQAQRIATFGRKWGTEPSRSITRRSDLRLRDYRGEVCLGAGLSTTRSRTPSFRQRSARLHGREVPNAVHHRRQPGRDWKTIAEVVDRGHPPKKKWSRSDTASEKSTSHLSVAKMSGSFEAVPRRRPQWIHRNSPSIPLSLCYCAPPAGQCQQR
jgi:hypothetical protein